ncbi:MAG: NAD(P)H-dependent oxidoreductase subunit E [Bacteroidales bacterium]|nr:NAD(P)H-dependent oxidoreductase subunit E [Bacteroidales bacterium]
METSIQQIIDKYQADPKRLMDILLDIQQEKGHIPVEINQKLANALDISKVDLEQTISFYHFFSQKSTGKYSIYLNDSVVANLMGREAIAETFEEEAGIKFGNVSTDGSIGLFNTSCIGMSDQEPAAIINGLIFNNLTSFRVKEIVRDMKEGKPIGEMFKANYGDGNNSNELIQSVVGNHIRRKGPVIWDEHVPGEGLKKAVEKDPQQVIDSVKMSDLRGRGGAGFPTGLKWEFCSKFKDDQKYIFCNADEGEPGTFKDRVILTEMPRLVFEGMAIAAYAVGATRGIIYIRYEYKYLQKYLEQALGEMRKEKLLGKEILGQKDFSFDIRIQYGAGAYVCGEESALLESAEGKRGEPRDRPPFPVEMGYLGKPTIINNVETFCSVVKILKNGPDWYKSFGTIESSGTKLLSISGDCRYPGVYELEWGFSIYDIIEMVGAPDCQAVQVGGPSGILIGPNDFRRKLCYEDLATGGSLIIFNDDRDLLKDVVLGFTEFFIEESCGSCSTCRNVPILLKQKLKKIISGNGVMQDIEDLVEWSKILKFSRCGLGLTAANPITTSISNFKYLYEKKVQKDREFDTGFNLAEAVKESCEAVGREPNV